MFVFTADRIFCSRWRSLLERAKRWNPPQQGRRLPVRLSKALWLQGSYPHFYQFQLFYLRFLYYFLLIKSEPFGFNIMSCLLVFRLDDDLQIDSKTRRLSRGRPPAQLCRRDPLNPPLAHQQILQNATITEKSGEWFPIGFWSFQDWQEWSVSCVLLIFLSVLPSARLG